MGLKTQNGTIQAKPNTNDNDWKETFERITAMSVQLPAALLPVCHTSVMSLQSILIPTPSQAWFTFSRLLLEGLVIQSCNSAMWMPFHDGMLSPQPQTCLSHPLVGLCSALMPDLEFCCPCAGLVELLALYQVCPLNECKSAQAIMGRCVQLCRGCLPCTLPHSHAKFL